MNIALDYDSTYTNDPTLWKNFIFDAHARGHTVICVTMRKPSEAVEMSIPVHYTSRKAKKSFMEALGIAVDIWIDDMPLFVLADAYLG